MPKSLRTRFTITGIVVVVVSLLAVAIPNLWTTQGSIQEMLRHQVLQVASTESQHIHRWFQGNQRIVSAVANEAGRQLQQRRAAGQDGYPDLQSLLPVLVATDTASGADMTWVGWEDRGYAFSEQRPRENYDPTTRVWYTAAVAAQGPVITEPHVGASSGKILVTLAEPIRDGAGRIAGVAGAGMMLDEIIASVGTIRPTPNSFAFLADSKGTLITFPDKALVLKPASEAAQTLSAAALRGLASSTAQWLTGGQSGDLPIMAVTLRGREGQLAAQQVPGTDLVLGIFQDGADASATLDKLLLTSGGITLLVMLCVAALLFFTIKGLMDRLNAVGLVLGRAGDGDFSGRVETVADDEIGQIARAANRFSDSISRVLKAIQNTGESVRVASGEIAAGNQDLAQRTTRQASALEDAASAIDQLSLAVRNNTESASEAARLASASRESAGVGEQAVTEMVATMQSINETSDKVVNIISVIDEIAFRTNILALNAAVEAARAGEQGKGFAVVASEVRSLAQRSAESAREVRALINTSAQQIEHGNALTERTSVVVQGIIQDIHRISTITHDISAASADQAQDVVRINDVVAQMSADAQQNSALVEEAASASGNLFGQADTLHQEVSVFRF